MGCDIHAHVEMRYEGKWEHLAWPNIDRWYDLFGIMAGVRRDVEPIVQPKGFPTDAALITRLDFEKWGPDAHTVSWFNEDEIDKLSAWLKKHEAGLTEEQRKNAEFGAYDLEIGVLNWTFAFGNTLTAFKHYFDVDYLPKGADAIRLVFWFDN